MFTEEDVQVWKNALFNRFPGSKKFVHKYFRFAYYQAMPCIRTRQNKDISSLDNVSIHLGKSVPLKLVLLGCSGVGKTTLMFRWTRDMFDIEYVGHFF